MYKSRSINHEEEKEKSKLGMMRYLIAQKLIENMIYLIINNKYKKILKYSRIIFPKKIYVFYQLILRIN